MKRTILWVFLLGAVFGASLALGLSRPLAYRIGVVEANPDLPGMAWTNGVYCGANALCRQLIAAGVHAELVGYDNDLVKAAANDPKSWPHIASK